MPERRKHPRIDLAAQVEVSSSDVVHLLRAENASRGGLFLQGNPENYPQFQKGTEVGLHICEVDSSDEEDDDAVDVFARARIVRIEEAGDEAQGGFAVEFVKLDDENQERLEKLLTRSGS